MKLNSKWHGIIDYAVVLFLLLAPLSLSLPSLTTFFTLTLALIHLGLTATTNFEMGVVKIIPLKTHGWIELVVSVSLIGLAFYLGSVEGSLARNFYLIFGAAVFVTWLVTDYTSAPEKN